MTLQHSPGPFRFHRPGWYIEDSEDNVIAEVNSAYNGDGHLFAAAPDMLRLLRVVCDQRNTWEELIAAIDEGRGIIRRLDGDT